MAELLETPARLTAKIHRPRGLSLAKCEGLPREMLESVSLLVMCIPFVAAQGETLACPFAAIST